MTRRFSHSALLGALALVFVLHSLYLAVVAEDAFITFRYAAHLAGGHGLVWNIGAPPVEGYTNFLWVLLCSGAIAAGWEVARFAQVLGLAAGLAALFYTWRFAERILGSPRPLSMLPPALLALSGPLAVWASSGMETALFTGLVAAGAYHAAVSWKSARGGTHAVAASLLFVGATLTRPEGALVAALAFAWSAWLGGRRWASALLVFIVALAAYEVWRVAYFGAWLPNTYYAKVGGTPYRVIRGVAYAGSFTVYFAVPFAPLAVLWRRAVARAAPEISWRETLERHAGAAFCGVVCLVYGAYVIWVGGDYMAMYRFFVPVLPFFYLLVGAAFVTRRSWERERGIAPGWSSSWLAVGIVITAIHSTPIDRVVFPKPPLQHGHYAGVQTERWHVARLALIGRFFGDYKKSGDESLATGAIGAVSYYSNLTVHGFHGLVDPEIAHRRASGKHPGLGLPGHEKGDIHYILSKRPTYLMLERKFTKEPGSYPQDLTPAAREQVYAEYEPVSVWLEDTANGEAGYFTFFERKR